MERLLSKTEAMEILGVSRATLDRLIAAGELEACRVGRLIRIRPEDLRAYLDRCRRAPTKKTAPAPANEKRGPGRPKGSKNRTPHEVYVPGMRVV